MGYGVHRLPGQVLDRERWWSRPRAWERGGDWYAHRLHIKRWKRRLPEAGAFFRGGVDKRHLPGTDAAGLFLMARETRRAELGHWLAAAPAPVFLLWNPWWAGAVMFVYAAVANGPCLAAQRYNRARLLRVLSRRASAR